MVVGEFGHRAQRVSESGIEIGLGGEDDPTESLKSRPPVVTMGHVDHGKTSHWTRFAERMLRKIGWYCSTSVLANKNC